MDRTTESSVVEMKLQIWHFGSLHSGAFRLAKPEVRSLSQRDVVCPLGTC